MNNNFKDYRIIRPMMNSGYMRRLNRRFEV